MATSTTGVHGIARDGFRSRLRRILWLTPLAAALFLGGPFGGCPCIVDARLHFHADFEGCGGALCGWEMVEGDARIVESFHSAEHALELVGANAAARHVVDGSFGSSTAYEFHDELTLLTTCGDGALSAELEYVDSAGGTTRTTTGLHCESRSGELYRCTAGIATTVDGSDGGLPSTLRAVTLRAAHDGCTVDHVIVQTVETHC